MKGEPYLKGNVGAVGGIKRGKGGAVLRDFTQGLISHTGAE